MLNVTAASQLRTLHGTAIALSVLRPGDGAEIGYHYLEGVRVVDWLRPYEKTVEGVVTGVDPARATVAFRDLAGRPRRMRVPPTAGKPSYDQQALVDLTTIRVGDEVTVWYVGPLDEAIVERLGARRAPGALGAATP